MFSTRTKLSLCQYLSLQTPMFLAILLQKHGIGISADYVPPDVLLTLISLALAEASPEQIQSLLEEIIRTSRDLRRRLNSKQQYDDRWEDLLHCLQLDGYKIDGRRLVSFDPTIAASPPIDDDLSDEIRRSSLPDGQQILQLLENSAEAFRRMPPDYNGCLSNVRVALETLARTIAKARQVKHPGSFDETKWGQVLAYLGASGFITRKEEEGIAGVYSFVSPGSHIPVGATEEEMARLGRSLVASMCYFLIKRYDG